MNDGGSNSGARDTPEGPYPHPLTPPYGDPRTGLGFPVIRVVLTHATSIGKLLMVNGPHPAERFLRCAFGSQGSPYVGYVSSAI